MRCGLPTTPPLRSHWKPVIKLGMYVLNETFDGWYIPKTYHDYARWFSEDWKQDVTAMVESARNHPSVILYSHGNEVSETATERGTEVCRELTDFYP